MSPINWRKCLQPLQGINVIDLTRALSEPFCSMVLADLGADVVNIEPFPDGDPTRASTANETRIMYRDELKTILESRLVRRNKRTWTELFIDAGLPAGPIQTLNEVFSDPQLQHCNLVETVKHSILGAVHQVVTPVSGFKYDGQPGSRLSRYAPPDLVEHTIEILGEAGFDISAIESLCGSRVVHHAERHQVTDALGFADGIQQ